MRGHERVDHQHVDPVLADCRLDRLDHGGGHPIRPKPEDWTSGETAWLLDVIAPSQRGGGAAAVLKNFRQVVQDRPVRVHPVVAQSVGPTMLIDSSIDMIE
jgi:cytolysin-activating lysine-acyltransferase